MDKIIIGLGNPGAKYKHNRHNIGAELIYDLARKYGNSNFQDKFQAQICNVKIDEYNCLLAFPQTYMNNSGISVQKIMAFYKLKSESLLVIHDELDLELGRIKAKLGGGAGGHNGLKSIDQHVGNNYYRLRIGIGHPGDKNMVANYVLSDFAKAESEQIEQIKNNILENIGPLLSGDLTKFSNQICK